MTEMIEVAKAVDPTVVERRIVKQDVSELVSQNHAESPG